MDLVYVLLSVISVQWTSVPADFAQEHVLVAFVILKDLRVVTIGLTKWLTNGIGTMDQHAPHHCTSDMLSLRERAFRTYTEDMLNISALRRVGYDVVYRMRVCRVR